MWLAPVVGGGSFSPQREARLTMRLDALQSQMLVCQARSLRARLKYLIGKVARVTDYVYFHLLARFEINQPNLTLLTFMMSPSLHYVLAASLRSKKSSSTITFQEDDITRSSSKCSLRRTSRLARLKQFWLFATGQ